MTARAAINYVGWLMRDGAWQAVVHEQAEAAVRVKLATAAGLQHEPVGLAVLPADLTPAGAAPARWRRGRRAER